MSETKKTVFGIASHAEDTLRKIKCLRTVVSKAQDYFERAAPDPAMLLNDYEQTSDLCHIAQDYVIAIQDAVSEMADDLYAAHTENHPMGIEKACQSTTSKQANQ